MTTKQVINIVGVSLIGVLVVTVIILSCIISNQNKDLILIKQEKNYLSQTIEKMRAEEEQKNIIYQQKDELLLEVKKSTTLKDYLKVWEKVNRSLEK